MPFSSSLNTVHRGDYWEVLNINGGAKVNHWSQRSNYATFFCSHLFPILLSVGFVVCVSTIKVRQLRVHVQKPSQKEPSCSHTSSVPVSFRRWPFRKYSKDKSQSTVVPDALQHWMNIPSLLLLPATVNCATGRWLKVVLSIRSCCQWWVAVPIIKPYYQILNCCNKKRQRADEQLWLDECLIPTEASTPSELADDECSREAFVGRHGSSRVVFWRAGNTAPVDWFFHLSCLLNPLTLLCYLHVFPSRRSSTERIGSWKEKQEMMRLKEPVDKWMEVHRRERRS